MNEARGWFRRKKGKLVYCWLNAAKRERSKVIGDAAMTDGQGWLHVGELGLNANIGKNDPVKVKFGEVLEAYLAYGKTKTGKDKAHSTKNTEERNARLYLSRWRNRVAKDVEPAEVQDWINSLSEGLQSKIRSLMSAVYRHGQKYGMIPRTPECNPMPWVSASEQTDFEAVPVSPEESFAILDQIEDPLVRCLIIVVAVTAVRIGEALGLMWSDIDWSKGKIHIRRDWVDGEIGEPKSRASKAAVEMHPALAAVLEEWRSETVYGTETDFVFPSYRRKGKQPRLGCAIAQKYIRPAAVQAGIIDESCPRFGFHNLRHGLSTFLIEHGTDPVVVQRILRQSNVTMTMHYFHAAKKARAAQGEFLEKFLPDRERQRVQ